MKVLILSCNTGGGHNAVAAALTEAFRRRGADCTVLDGLSFISQKASKLVSRWHTRMYRHHPHLYKAGYMTAEEEVGRTVPKHNLVERYLARGARRLYRFLQTQRFDAVVCVHVIPALMMTMLRKNGGAPMPFCFVATDYTCSPSVGDCTPDICVIPHEELAEEFVRCGMAAETLLPAGIPTRSVFNAPVDRAAARRALSLPAEGRHILLMSGSIGCGPMTELARQLDEQLRSGDYATVLCGSNRQMLYALQRRSLLRVQAVGFTSQVAQYMDSADLLVSKPGGISITEAACKGVPMLLADLVGGCETRNQAFFAEHGWAAACSNDTIADSALSLLADDARREALVSAQRRDFDGRAAARVADAVLCRCGQAPAAIAVHPQRSPHPGQQLTGAEGLGDIVVGTEVEGLDLILLGGAGRQDDDGGQILLPDGADRVQTIPVGQAEVQDDEVRIIGDEHGHAHHAGLGHQRLIAVGLQQRLNEAADIGLIFHHKDLEFIIAHLRSPPSRFLLSLTRTEWSCPHRVCFRL